MFGIRSVLAVRDPLLQAGVFVNSRPWLRNLVFILAGVLFLAGGAISFLYLPELPELTAWPLLLVASLGVPANVLLGARRFQVSADIVNADYRFLASLNITLTSMAANILPLPAGAAIRLLALKRANSTYFQAAGITAVTALLWVALAMIVAGTGLWLAEGSAELTMILCAGGLLGALAALGWLVSVGARLSQAGELLGLQLGLVLLDAARLWLVSFGLGFSIAFERVAVLTVSSVASAAIGFAPGGLGIRELVAAGLAPLVGISPALAFLMSGVDRLIGMGLIALAMFFLWKRSNAVRRREGSS